MTIVCPSCSSQSLRRMGEISPTNIFAGRVLSEPLPGGSLFCCESCLLYFRSPQLEKQELDALYQQGAPQNWQHEPQNRRDWLIAAEWIKENCERGKILDLGCFDGQFLFSLENEHELFGIEIHQNAAQRAERKGVRILSGDFSNLGKLDYLFDVIVAADVVEHVSDPMLLLMNLSKLTRSGGVVIIATGNTQALAWRMMGSRYWYCTIAEHISFISPEWCDRAAKRAGFAVEKLELFSHSSAGWPKRIVDLVKNTCYRFAPGISAWLRTRGVGGKDVARYPVLANHPPNWMSATDYMIALLRKH